MGFAHPCELRKKHIGFMAILVNFNLLYNMLFSYDWFHFD